MLSRYDLHIHTNASDGTLTPQEVVEEALRIGIDGFAITDHDTVAGLKLASYYIKQYCLPLNFIPGIELNTEILEEEVHILGYFINSDDATLLDYLRNIHNERYKRIKKMVLLLQQIGMRISLKQVEALAHGESIGRPHVGRALIANGYVKTIKEAFAKYIGRGCVAYVPRYKFTPYEAINLIKSAGGISVLAHPGLIKRPEIIMNIINLGIEGLEVFYPEHSADQEKELASLAIKHSLLQTGGSDYHGPDSQENRFSIGQSTISIKELEQIYSYLDKKRTPRDSENVNKPSMKA